MSTARGVIAGLCCLIAMASLSCTGCGSLPFAQSPKERALRKQAEADSFPTAQQAGLRAAKE